MSLELYHIQDQLIYWNVRLHVAAERSLTTQGKAKRFWRREVRRVRRERSYWKSMAFPLLYATAAPMRKHAFTLENLT